MSEPFLGEVRLMGFDFAPRGWARCDGQLLPISQNQSLYSLLGTTYGGDGRTTLALPDLRGRVPLHRGRGNGGREHLLGQKSGAEVHRLSPEEMPAHAHAVKGAREEADSNAPAGALPGRAVNLYTPGDSGRLEVQNLMPETVGWSGEGQGHQNMQPSLAVTFCIALRGLFPSRN